ncbi:MAG: SAM-dependent methyltransferase, partial [Alphaproteobacteria bacterium]
MTPLGQHLSDQIRIHGPLSIAGYMASALGHPKWGYYTSRDPLGRSGDFTTAPEISQMFGELIGLWCADRWQTMGAPAKFVLAELGPGRGTLIADALRAAAALPGFAKAVELHLVETSPVLRAAQEISLEGQQAIWHERIEDLPESPVTAIANEFFDALPIRQFQATEDGWHERLVDADEKGFHLVLSPQATPGDVITNAAPGDIFEISPTREAAVSDLSRRIDDRGGVALIIDYGH